MLYELACGEIRKLPDFERDVWPFLPREIFHCIDPEPSITVDFRGYVIVFGMAVKEINRYPAEWEDRLRKFEDLLARTYWTRATVQLWAPSYADGQLGIDPSSTVGSNHFPQWQYLWEADAEGLSGLSNSPPQPTRTWTRYDPMTRS